jgi:hypothetical protein
MDKPMLGKQATSLSKHKLIQVLDLDLPRDEPL